VKFQQWDGAKWKVITDWMEPDRKLVRQKVEDDARQYAKEKSIEPRDCAKEN
jgi:branched-chain amino acid transport system substrate-binding protein